jgi:hypothetical protein
MLSSVLPRASIPRPFPPPLARCARVGRRCSQRTMHSNGGRGLIAEATSPAVDESRRSGKPAALARLRSYGGTYPTAGAIGEESRIV